MGTRRYGISLWVFSSISHEWVQRLRKEILYLQAIMFLAYCKWRFWSFSEYFLLLSEDFRRLPKLSNGQTNVSEHFPKIKLREQFYSLDGMLTGIILQSKRSLFSYESKVWHLSKESFYPLPRLCLFVWRVTWWMGWDWQVWRGCTDVAVRRPWRSWEHHRNPLWLLWRLAHWYKWAAVICVD